MRESNTYKENGFSRFKQNKSDLITQSHPFQDISNLNQNRSSVHFKEKDFPSKRESNSSKVQTKHIQADPESISIKFRIPINEFSEDYFVFNLQLKPQLNLSHLIEYFIAFPPLQKIKEKRKQLQSEIMGIKKFEEWQFTGTFSYANQKISTNTTVQQLHQNLESSNQKEQLIDFTFDWIPRPIKNEFAKVKSSQVLSSQQSCCILM